MYCYTQGFVSNPCRVLQLDISTHLSSSCLKIGWFQIIITNNPLNPTCVDIHPHSLLLTSGSGCSAQWLNRLYSIMYCYIQVFLFQSTPKLSKPNISCDLSDFLSPNLLTDWRIPDTLLLTYHGPDLCSQMFQTRHFLRFAWFFIPQPFNRLKNSRYIIANESSYAYWPANENLSPHYC